MRRQHGCHDSYPNNVDVNVAAVVVDDDAVAVDTDAVDPVVVRENNKQNFVLRLRKEFFYNFERKHEFRNEETKSKSFTLKIEGHAWAWNSFFTFATKREMIESDSNFRFLKNVQSLAEKIHF